MSFYLTLHFYVTIERVDHCVFHRIKLIADFERRFEREGVLPLFRENAHLRGLAHRGFRDDGRSPRTRAPRPELSRPLRAAGS